MVSRSPAPRSRLGNGGLGNLAAEPPANLWISPFSLLNIAQLHPHHPSYMDTQEIRAVHAVLHLISHRNKNQHQRAKWWKWLARLKRTAADLESQNARVAISAAYKQYLSKHLIPKCYLAFSTVIAENQFSTLGIVLLATLSRFAKATGTKFEEETRQRPQVKKKTQSAPPTEDRGERVSRADIGVAPSLEHEPQVHGKKSTQPTDAKSSTVKKSKKVKRKKNAIDDLFSGLF